MVFRALPLLAVLAGLAACGDWPDLPRGPGAPAGAWPTLQPLDLDALPDGDAAQRDAAGLMARAQALQARARLLRTPVPDDAAFERLRARLAG